MSLSIFQSARCFVLFCCCVVDFIYTLFKLTLKQPFRHTIRLLQTIPRFPNTFPFLLLYFLKKEILNIINLPLRQLIALTLKPHVLSYFLHFFLVFVGFYHFFYFLVQDFFFRGLENHSFFALGWLGVLDFYVYQRILLGMLAKRLFIYFFLGFWV